MLEATFINNLFQPKDIKKEKARTNPIKEILTQKRLD